MIRITDRTLSCLDDVPPDVPSLSRFLEFLIEMDADAIELSEKMYRLLSPLPPYSSYVLQIGQASDTTKFPDIPRFVCRNAPAGSNDKIRTEILLNDIRESYTIARYAECAKLRICGLDDMLTGDYLRTFGHLKECFYGDIEFCPANGFHCAAALAAEWVLSGTGTDIVTSFGGVGGFAPTEELIIILRVQRLRKAGKTYEFFPEMAELLRKITGQTVRPNKPVIGQRIFHVESGIHVDGIAKQPKCYEPFPPEVVGLTRKVVIGKHSGAQSVLIKLEELGLTCDKTFIPVILERVKQTSAEKNGALTNLEFIEIVRGCRS